MIKEFQKIRMISDYPKTICGNEYYRYDINKHPIYHMKNNQSEYYAKDCKNNEIYPYNFIEFAKDENGKFFYAKNKNMDEYYPRKNKMNIVLKDSNGNMIAAKYKSGKEKYPKDQYGNQYNLVDCNNKPRYLKDEHGQEYYPVTKNGHVIILALKNIQKFLPTIILSYKCLDVLNNEIFTNDSNMFDCICC